MTTSPSKPIGLAAFAKLSGRSERMLRNDIAAGMPTTGAKPIKIEPAAALGWLQKNAAGARPGPGRPKNLPDSSKSQSPQRETASNGSASSTKTDPESVTKVTRAPFQVDDVDETLLNRVLAGTASPREILKFSVESGITRADLENYLAVSRSVQASIQVRKTSGNLIDAAAVKETWTQFGSGLQRGLKHLIKRAADAVLAELKLKPDSHSKIERAIAREVEVLKDQLKQGDDEDGEAAQDAGPG